MDILLIQPPIRDFYLTAKRTIPYGLACLASPLLREGFKVNILDCLATSRSRVIPMPEGMDYLLPHYGMPDRSPFALFHAFRHYGHSFDRIGKEVKESGAFLVGISSLFTAYSEEALEVARTVRRHLPHCKIVLGGHHPTELPRDVMQCEAVDFVIRGEGEAAMPALARFLSKQEDPRALEDVPGLVFRKHDGTLHVPPPVVLPDLDGMPPPAFHLLNHHFYGRNGRSGMVVVTSRGCPQKCTYCSVGGASYITCRRRSIEAVLAEIREAVTRHSVGFIDFEDENISNDRKWFLELLGELKRQFGPWRLELRAMNGLFPPGLDSEMIGAMKVAGFRTLNLALATTSRRTLRRFKRADVSAAFQRAVFHAHACGLETVGYIIVGAPGQDPLDSVNDLIFLAGQPVLGGVSVYYPAPGSEDYDHCSKNGLLPPFPGLMRSTALPICETTSREETATLLRLGRILNYLKLLQARRIDLSFPSPPGQLRRLEVADRHEAGRVLLLAFLNDGKIRGITPDGEVYEHQTSARLTARFLDGIKPFLPIPPTAFPDATKPAQALFPQRSRDS